MINPVGTQFARYKSGYASETTNDDFYRHFMASYESRQRQVNALPVSSASSASAETQALEDLLGEAHIALSRQRGIDEKTQARYADILEKAYSSGGMNDPQQFLKSLSVQDLDVIRRNHCLAAPIDPAGLSREGASNLLLPEGYALDLNKDGIEEVGLAQMIHFPPRDAPDAFKQAWAQATEGVDFGHALVYALNIHTAIYGLHGMGGSSEPLRDSTSMDTYRNILLQQLDLLEHNKTDSEKYQRDKGFYTRLLALL